MEDSQKRHKKASMKRRRRKEKKTTKKQKKSEDPPKTTFKNRYSFKRRRMKKIGETRIEYKRDVKHIKISKTFLKIKFFFLEKNRRKMMRRFKNEGFLCFKKLKKHKIGDAKSDHKSSKKRRRNQKHLYLDGRKNGTRKDMCFFFLKK